MIAPTAGMFTLYMKENGDVYAEYVDEGEAPKFTYDAESGALYYIIGEEA